MPTNTFIQFKRFNPPRVIEELDALALPSYAVEFPGFKPFGNIDRVDPFAEATREIMRSEIKSVITTDTADRGEIRVVTDTNLNADNIRDIKTSLTAHDATIDAASQAKQRAELNDIATLRAAYDAGIADPTLALTTKFTLLELGEDI